MIKATENYKERSLDLKHELKLLKNLNQTRTACTSKLENTEIAQNESSLDEENKFSNQANKKKQKEAVLGDIRNLIQEYKKER